MIKFQDELLNRIDNLTIADFPHTLLLSGDRGCGKHTLVKYISDKYGLDVRDITEQLSLDTINDIYSSVVPTFYLINTDNISIREQNVILKFLEEPSELIYIILICCNKNSLIPTVANRCISWEFHKYTRDELKEFTNDECVLDLCTTVGQVLDCQNFNLDDIRGYFKKIFDCINRASTPNILYALPKHIAWKGEKDLYPVDISFKILYNMVCDMIKVDKYNCFDIWEITHKLVNDLYIPNIDKKQRYEKYLLDLANWYKYKDM